MTEATSSPEAVDMTERAPDPPLAGPWRWMRENLFSGHTRKQIAFNSFLTLVFALVLINMLQFLTTFLFSPDRKWPAVTHNMKLLMVQAFPQDDLVRIWVSLGIFLVLVVWSMASWQVGGRLEVSTFARGLRNGAALVAVAGIMHHGAGTRAVGIPGLRFDLPAEWSTVRIWIFVAAIMLAVLGHMVARRSRNADPTPTIPLLLVPVLGMAVVAMLLWTVRLPVPLGQFDQTTAPIATTTAGPWTILFAVAVVAYVLGLKLESHWPRPLRRFLISAWVLSYPVIIFVIQRNPILDWPDMLGFGETPFLRSDLGTMLLFSLVVGAAVRVLALPTKRSNTSGVVVATGVAVAALPFAFGGGPLWASAGMGLAGLAVVAGGLTVRESVEMVRASGAGLALACLFVWFVPMPFLYRVLILAFAIFVMMAPTFGGTVEGRTKLVRAWIATTVLIVVAFRLGAADTSLEFQGTTFLGGFNLTILLAITGIALSLPVGLILALARTSTMPIFRLLATGYIELVRSVPMITWLFFGSAMLTAFLPAGVEFDEIIRIVAAISIFNSAYVAENIRGGLQAIDRGQYEAARATGLSIVQSTSLIILPQAVRTVIPALVGSVIIAFKDTSLVAIIGLADVLLIARSFIPQQSDPNFQGTLPQMMFFMAVFYWIFTFTISRLGLRYESSVGLGER